MGCLGSKPDVKLGNPSINEASAKSYKNLRTHSYALDGPPNFGVETVFEVCKLLGEGMSGQTWLCRDLATSKRVACKFIERPIPLLALPMLKHEIKIQAALGRGHINLVSAQEVILSPTHLCIVLEYAAGGNLTQYINAKVLNVKYSTTKDKAEADAEEADRLVLSEEEARYYFKQYLAALEFLHANRVAHRDFKLDNIVLDGGKPPRIKLCDFGFAKSWDAESNMLTQIGTPVYMSPQLISTRYSKLTYDAVKADVYACGVALFVLLLGVFPYDHADASDPNTSHTYAEVQQQHREFNWRQTRNGSRGTILSQECQDLLDKIFERDDHRRITIDQIKQHPWYCQPLPAHYQAALDLLQQQQAELDEGFQSVRDEVDDDMLERALEEAGPVRPGQAAPDPIHKILLQRASELHGGTAASAQLMRIKLRPRLPEVSQVSTPVGTPKATPTSSHCGKAPETTLERSPLSRPAVSDTKFHL